MLHMALRLENTSGLQMNKELLKTFQLQAGGSHYPGINPEMQLAFARMIVDECIDAVRSTNQNHAYTTFDKGMIQSTIDKSVKAIEERFQHNAVQVASKSSKITPVGGTGL